MSALPFIQFPGEIIEWATEILVATTALIRAEVTTFFLEQVVCELYNLMPDTAIVDQAMIDAWSAAVEPLAPLAGPEFARIIYLVPINEWRKRAIIGASTPYDHCAALCEDDGEWCYEIDFTAANGGWARVDPGSTTLMGSYVGGTGWTTDDALDTVPAPDVYNRMMYIGKTLATTTTFTHVEIDLTYTKGSFLSNRRAQGIEIGIGYATTIIDINSTPAADGAPLLLTWDGSINSNSIVVFARSSCVSGSPVYSGQAILGRVLVRGTGDNPFGADNCS